MSAIFNPRDLLMQATPTRLLPITLPSNLVIPILDQLKPNLDRPPTPNAFSAVGALTHVNLMTGPPNFTQGHGYNRTNIYGAIWTGGPLPVQADAVPVFSYVGQVGSMPSQPATRWHLWATWVSVDGVESLPAGGLNGVVGVTGEDVNKLVAAMTGPGKPFTIVNEPTTLSDGTVVPAGTYTSNAFMGRFVAGRGQIGLLAVDDARIASASATKLVSGTVQVGVHIGSSNYVSGVQGWAINGQGGAEFSGVTVRGTIVATAGTIGGNTITAGGIYSPNYQAGVSGWGLDYQGNAAFNSISLRGAIMGGAFQGYAWPGNGGGGFYLGPPGLLLGNAGLGRYVQITEAGNFYAPGMSIENGLLTISQVNVIKTAQIAGNAISVMRSSSGAAVCSTTMYIPPYEVMSIAVFASVEGISIPVTAGGANTVYAYVDGVQVGYATVMGSPVFGNEGPTSYNVSSGVCLGRIEVYGGGGRTVTISAADDQGSIKTVVALGTMR